ncbi:MAG TPA: methylmalonyl-CoA mutase family protein [Elusimicrobiota bacterium]|nr:methylmalonyl-CoA mutase family protein [Elusimicrobiota bacterium]
MSEDFVTPSGIAIQRVYAPPASGGAAPDTRDPAWEKARLGRAGEAPFTRGIQKTMYRGRLWTMRQYAGFGTAAETNARFKYLLEHGQTGLSTAFDLPTQMGLDADSPRAEGEVGRVGVHIGSLDDMETLFAGIPMGEVSTSLTINATASVLLSFYAAAAKKAGADPAALRGTLQNDILKEYLARGTYIFPIDSGLRLCVDAIEHSVRHIPKFHPISISGYHIREAGSDAVQEIAFTFLNAETYVKALLDRGLGVDQFGPQLAFFFGCHNHMLEEIAKFRAARRVWFKLMSEDYKAKDPKTLSLRFHVQTCGSTLTSQQPLNNAARVALQALSAVLGGCQSLHTNSFDEALALPTEEAAQLALRTQQILAFETGVPDTADPLAGAYAIEALTDQLEEKIWETIRRVRAAGGMLAAMSQGLPQAEIQESAYRYQKEIEAGRRKVVGVNCYPVEVDAKSKREILRVSPKLEAEQKERLARFKAARAAGAVSGALGELTGAAKSKENLLPFILRAVEARATLGEICEALRGVFGEYHGS